MRFAELCVLEIGKDAGRVERECRITGQIAGERSICAIKYPKNAPRIKNSSALRKPSLPNSDACIEEIT